MAERPIPFSGAMVRAIQAGTKTQTRRVVKWRGLQPGLNLSFSGLSASRIVETWVLESPSRTSREWRCQPTPCPYGKPGDRLWVREAWSTHACFDHIKPSELKNRSLHYWADGEIKTGKRRPGMFMPRWASRITLEVTGVRVERLQDISAADAIAEGQQHGGEDSHAPWGFDGVAASFCDCPVTAYSALWESINGAGSWAANPWVWAVEFKRHG